MRANIVFALVGLVILSAIAAPTRGVAADETPNSPAAAVEKPALEEWRKATTPSAPNQKGCFQVEFPSKEWKQVDCGEEPADAPRTIRPQRPGLIHPETLPLGGDYTLTPTKPITSATGRLITLNSVTTVGSRNAADGTVTPGKFSLQVNSNFGLPATPATGTSCAKSGNTSCSGWIQFVYNNDRQLFIQYWLINYLTAPSGSCPSGLSQSSESCGANAAFLTLPSSAPSDFKTLQGATLTGQAFSNGKVSATLTVGGKSYATVGDDVVGAFGSKWTTAEFNVFGYGTNSSGAFTTVQLNPEAQVTVGLTSDNDASEAEPSCQTGSTTAENSNMFLGPCSTTTVPGIWFNESPTVPTVNSIKPTAGPSSGGTPVQISGGQFDRQVQLKFGTQIVSTTIQTTNIAGVVSPAGALGSQVNLTAAYIFPNGSPGPFSAASPASQFSYVRVPTCTFSEFCPFFENQPPTYSVACGAPSDFYTFPGVPADPEHPIGLTQVELDTPTNTGLMSAEELQIVACVLGTKSDCFIHSLQTEQKNWCINHNPPPPPPKCSQCGNKKCCPDPFGGVKHICVALTSACPPLQ